METRCSKTIFHLGLESAKKDMCQNAPCYEVERGEVMKKTWYLIIGVVILVIGCIAYGYHEHHKPKTAQELKTVRVAYLPITHALPVFATKELETADGPVHVELV